MKKHCVTCQGPGFFGFCVCFFFVECTCRLGPGAWALASPWQPALQPRPHGPVLASQVIFSRYCNSSDIMDLFCIATGLPR